MSASHRPQWAAVEHSGLCHLASILLRRLHCQARDTQEPESGILCKSRCPGGLEGVVLIRPPESSQRKPVGACHLQATMDSYQPAEETLTGACEVAEVFPFRPLPCPSTPDKLESSRGKVDTVPKQKHPFPEARLPSCLALMGVKKFCNSNEIRVKPDRLLQMESD